MLVLISILELLILMSFFCWLFSDWLRNHYFQSSSAAFYFLHSYDQCWLSLILLSSLLNCASYHCLNCREWDHISLSWLISFWVSDFWLSSSWLSNFCLRNHWLTHCWLSDIWLHKFWLSDIWLNESWLSDFWLNNSWLRKSWLTDCKLSCFCCFELIILNSLHCLHFSVKEFSFCLWHYKNFLFFKFNHFAVQQMNWEILINLCLISYLNEIISQQKSVFQVSQSFYYDRYMRMLISLWYYDVVNWHDDSTHALISVFVLSNEFLHQLLNRWNILRFQIIT